jgi:putative hydrolase of the HAD superfamily
VAERSVDAVVFDYGGVLTTPIWDAVASWQAAEGIDPASYLAAMRDWLLDPDIEHDEPSPVHLLETGELPVAEFERMLAGRLTTVDGRPIAAAGMALRMLAGTRHDPAMAALVADLRAAGVRIGLLSNSWGNTYPPELARFCDTMVISGEVGLRKPDPRIYRLTLDRLGVPADRAAFIDDLAPNADAAAVLGMHAVRHVDPATTRAAISALVPGLN